MISWMVPTDHARHGCPRSHWWIHQPHHRRRNTVRRLAWRVRSDATGLGVWAPCEWLAGAPGRAQHSWSQGPVRVQTTGFVLGARAPNDPMFFAVALATAADWHANLLARRILAPLWAALAPSDRCLLMRTRAHLMLPMEMFEDLLAPQRAQRIRADIAAARALAPPARMMFRNAADALARAVEPWVSDTHPVPSVATATVVSPRCPLGVFARWIVPETTLDTAVVADGIARFRARGERPAVGSIAGERVRPAVAGALLRHWAVADHMHRRLMGSDQHTIAMPLGLTRAARSFYLAASVFDAWTWPTPDQALAPLRAQGSALVWDPNRAWDAPGNALPLPEEKSVEARSLKETER